MPRHDNVRQAIEQIRTVGKAASFELGGFTIPQGGHLQGIQLLDPRTCVLSKSSSSVACFCIVRWEASLLDASDPGIGRVIAAETITAERNHAGGIQVLDNFLAVGVEDDGELSDVCFYDLSDPFGPWPIGKRIERRGKEWYTSAGAVGLARRERDYLLIVGGWDSNNVDFYVSDSLDLECCALSPHHWDPRTDPYAWHKDIADKAGWCDPEWRAYQNLNLIRQDDGALFLVGFAGNWADFYVLDPNGEQPRALRKMASKQVLFADKVGFIYGGGVYAYGSPLQLRLLTCVGDIEDEDRKIQIF